MWVVDTKRQFYGVLDRKSKNVKLLPHKSCIGIGIGIGIGIRPSKSYETKDNPNPNINMNPIPIQNTNTNNGLPLILSNLTLY